VNSVGGFWAPEQWRRVSSMRLSHWRRVASRAAAKTQQRNRGSVKASSPLPFPADGDTYRHLQKVKHKQPFSIFYFTDLFFLLLQICFFLGFAFFFVSGGSVWYGFRLLLLGFGWRIRRYCSVQRATALHGERDVVAGPSLRSTVRE